MPSFSTTSLDVARGARQWLAQWPEVQAALVPPPTPLHETDWDLWLFQDKIQVMVEGSQATACVLRHAGHWTTPNAHNTMRFPRLLTEIWADPARDQNGSVRSWAKAKERIWTAHAAIDAYLHDPGAPARWWPNDQDGPVDGMRVLRCTRLGELEMFPEPDGDGLVRAECFYAVGLG